MAVTEAQRHHLANRAHDVLGADPGATLMELLPPAGWGDVVTREVLHAEVAVVRSEVAVVRSEVAVLRADMVAGFAEVRTELHEELRDLYVKGLTGMGIIVGAATAVSALIG